LINQLLNKGNVSIELFNSKHGIITEVDDQECLVFLDHIDWNNVDASDFINDDDNEEDEGVNTEDIELDEEEFE
jgi:hypothetical protein